MELKYIGESLGYQCYLNKEGYIEGYRSTGLILKGKYCNVYKNCNRIITKCKTLREFYIAMKKPKVTESKYKQLKLDL